MTGTRFLAKIIDRVKRSIPKSFQFITELLFSEYKLFSSESISIHIVANNSIQWIISFVYSSKHVLLNKGLVLRIQGERGWSDKEGKRTVRTTVSGRSRIRWTVHARNTLGYNLKDLRQRNVRLWSHWFLGCPLKLFPSKGPSLKP